MCSEAIGRMHGDACVLDTTRPRRTPGGLSHEGEVTEQEEEGEGV